MQRALQLASKGEGWVKSNPMVGCVIVHNEKIVAEGYHSVFGKPHAEVEAFNNLNSDINPIECEVYITLEPCSHHGKTPPCVDLLIDKKPQKVIVAMLDPNPVVKGKGIAKLKNAGINVELGLLEKEAQSLNEHFVHYHNTGKPFVTLKWAETSDGLLGRKDASLPSQISNDKNGPLVHRLRANHEAILVGANTANQDNPKLTVRHWNGHNPVPFILSQSGNLREDLFLLKENNAIVVKNLDDLYAQLESKGIQSLLVEGGTEVLNSFIQKDLWNEIIVLKSPIEWKEGIAAPVVPHIPSKTIQLNGDLISYYSR